MACGDRPAFSVGRLEKQGLSTAPTGSDGAAGARAQFHKGSAEKKEHRPGS